MEIPCVLDCPDRTSECHATCPEYAKYAAWRDEVRKERQERAAQEAALNHGKRRRYAIRVYNERRKKE